MAEAAPPVTPCQERDSPTISCRSDGQLGHADGGLVGFPAGGDQQHAIELARRQLGQQRGQIDDRARQDRGIEVVELADGVAHDLDDLGMAVADDGAHLAGAEVEDAPALRVPHEAALRALGDDRREVAAVADRGARAPSPRTRHRRCPHRPCPCRSCDAPRMLLGATSTN